MQPLDLTVNRSFKCKLKKRYITSIRATTGEEKTRERLNTLLDNVALAVAEVSEACVLNGWSKMAATQH